MLIRRLGGVLAAFLMVITLLLLAPTDRAAAACSNGPFVLDCDVEVETPSTPGTIPTPPGGEPVGFTPGPQVCSFQGAELPCSSPDGWWNGTNCYVKLTDPQPAPGPNHSEGLGAWYTCTPAPAAPCDPAAGPCIIRDQFGVTFWSDTPPPGVVQYTPAQAAYRLARTFQLRAIGIGMAPANKVHDDDPAGTAPYRRTWVGIPVWLWVDNPQPLTVGPYTETATLGGVTVTATATVAGVVWSSGDRQSVNCGAGTPFNLAVMADRVAEDSPTCGFRFQSTSIDQPGEAFTVSATTQWTVAWTGGGQNGQIAIRDTTSSAPVQVGELQSVITPNQPGDDTRFGR